MFTKHKESRRHPNPILVFFRLALSLVVFICLILAVYFAYVQFSGYDPLKIDPKTLIPSLISSNPEAEKIVNKLSSVIKLPAGFQIPGFNQSKTIASSNSSGLTTEVPLNPAPVGDVVFSFLLVADSHNDNINLAKAIAQAKQSKDIKFIIGLGDYTQVGTLDELKQAKVEFDNSTIRYFLVPGDHDLWDGRNRKVDPLESFKKLFGPSYQTFDFDNFRFILIDNSDDYLGLGESQLSWVTDQLTKAKQAQLNGVFVFLHEPLFHPSSDHVMGKVTKELLPQAQSLIYQFKAAGVNKVFAGDIHYFTEYVEPQTNLNMVTLGAVTSTPNAQAPRYGIVDVYSNGDTKVNDIEIK